MSLLRRREMMAEAKQEKWDYEAYLTDSGQWFGKRCSAIVFDVHSEEQYQIEWSNCNTAGKYVYDMRKCGGQYLLIILHSPDGSADPSGMIEITIPSDGVLYVGIGNSANAENGSFNAACFDGDYIRIRKVG